MFYQPLVLLSVVCDAGGRTSAKMALYWTFLRLWKSCHRNDKIEKLNFRYNNQKRDSNATTTNGPKQMKWPITNKLYATRDEARHCRSVTYWFRGVYLHPLLSRLSPNVNLNILSKLVNWTLCTQSRYNNPPHSDYIIAICSAHCYTSQKLWAMEWMINEMIFGRAAPWHGYRTRLQHQVPHF